ncbi:MAG: Asp-tRNA(Asn)/Glu-tRNA(Gln) amidotransferase subunit GatC [Chlamydiia bacterium]|nr:Asp-tRNA(Asn)/Glu-tRNA(Gln) amidotransferase subunit GatC [Chlamydiia bacterium]
MANIDKKTIEKLAKLSRIHCEDSELEPLTDNIKNILAYAEQLNELNTDDVPPCNHVLEGMFSVMRDDVVGDVLPRETFLANAPDQIGGMIRTPPVLRGSSDA